MNVHELRAAYAQLHDEGMRLAGERGDAARRAAVFCHLYQHSGRNHVFPLIAAHATLWVRDYAALGKRLAWWLSWQYGLVPAWRRSQLAGVEAFSGALLDVNRRICAAAYAAYFFMARHGSHPDVQQIVHPALVRPLGDIHAARKAECQFSDEQKLAAFWPHFLFEQEFQVGPGVRDALAGLDWPVVKFLALRPMVRFAYFPPGRRLWFVNSLSHQQRVANGLHAFQFAVRAGWQHVEESLCDYESPPATALERSPALSISAQSLGIDG